VQADLVHSRLSSDVKVREASDLDYYDGGLPPEATDVQCASLTNDAGVLLASCVVDASSVDEVAFAVADDGVSSGRPFMSYAASTDNNADDVVIVKIKGLKPNHAYNVSVHTHRRGKMESQWKSWSEPVRCIVPLLDKQRLSAKADANKSSTRDVPRRKRSRSLVPSQVFAKSLDLFRAVRRRRRNGNHQGPSRIRWLEVFRYAKSEFNLPDFLDNRNAMDLAGAGIGADALLTQIIPFTSGFPEDYPTLLTRYCIEIVDTILPNVTSQSYDAEPESSPYADYVSCDQGDCFCMHFFDRSWSGQKREKISEACPKADRDPKSCKCTNSSLHTSMKYTGMFPVRLPLNFKSGRFEEADLLKQWGAAFSHPAGGRCALGKQVGDNGCTWQRSPYTHTVYSDELIESGLIINQPRQQGRQNAFAGQHNIGTVKSFFKHLSTCGDSTA